MTYTVDWFLVVQHPHLLVLAAAVVLYLGVQRCMTAMAPHIRADLVKLAIWLGLVRRVPAAPERAEVITLPAARRPSPHPTKDVA